MKKDEIKNILVPVDFTETSEIAVDEAVGLALELNAVLHLIHIVDNSESVSFVDRELELALSSLYDVEKEAGVKLSGIAEEIDFKYGIKPVFETSIGLIHTEILQYVEEHNINLIVMGTHGASGYKEYIIGSNAQRIVSHAKIPVLTLQQGKTITGFKNILIPIDNSLHSREKVNLALIVADLFDAKIHILGLLDSKEKTELNKFKTKLKAIEIVIAADELPYSTTIVDGDSLAEEAMAYAAEHRCDLIVINTGHESKIGSAFLGAFAQHIVNHSKIPVLSLNHHSDHYMISTPGFGI